MFRQEKIIINTLITLLYTVARETRTNYFILFISWYWCQAIKTPFPLVSYVTAQDDSIAIEATIAYLYRGGITCVVRNILNISLAALRDAAACRDDIDEITNQRGYRTCYNVYCIMRFVIDAFKRNI